MAAVVSMSACSLNLVSTGSAGENQYNVMYCKLRRQGLQLKTSAISQEIQAKKRTLQRKFTVVAVTKGSSKSADSEETLPSWAKPNSDEPPPWARTEGQNTSEGSSFEVPFYVYLLASTITAIAAIGSIFEYINQKPIFGLLESDSIFYAPILGFFAFTGVPTSAFLWYKSVQVANKEAEEQDKRDGYR